MLRSSINHFLQQEHIRNILKKELKDITYQDLLKLEECFSYNDYHGFVISKNPYEFVPACELSSPLSVSISSLNSTKAYTSGNHATDNMRSEREFLGALSIYLRHKTNCNLISRINSNSFHPIVGNGGKVMYNRVEWLENSLEDLTTPVRTNINLILTDWSLKQITIENTCDIYGYVDKLISAFNTVGIKKVSEEEKSNSPLLSSFSDELYDELDLNSIQLTINKNLLTPYTSEGLEATKKLLTALQIAINDIHEINLKLKL